MSVKITRNRRELFVLAIKKYKVLYVTGFRIDYRALTRVTRRSDYVATASCSI